MIEFIQGKIVELTPTQAVILTAGGVAYDLNISVYTFSALQNRDEARLYVYEAIREDAYILYGFTDKQERELFLMLISVPGRRSIGQDDTVIILTVGAYRHNKFRQ